MGSGQSFPFDASTMVALTPSAAADGGDAATVQLTVRDTTGAIVPGREVMFIGSDDVQLSAPSTTDDLGQALVVAKSRVVHTESIKAQVRLNDAWSALRQEASIGFFDPNQTPQNLTLSLSTSGGPTFVADGNDAVILTLTVMDGTGAMVVNAPVSVSVSGAGNRLSAASGVLGPMGTFTTTLASTAAGVKNVTMQVGAQMANVAVTFAAGPMDADHSQLTLAPSQISSDGVSQGLVRLTARDVYNNPLANTQAAFASDTPTTVLLASQATTGAAGDAFITLVATQTGTTMVTATVKGVTLSLEVPVVPPQASGLYSRLVVPQRAVQADGVSQAPISVTVYDAAKNPVADTVVKLVSTDPQDSFSPNTGTTDAQGQFSSMLSSQLSGAKTILATFGRVSVGATATFVPLNADFTRSVLTVSPSMVVADGKQRGRLLVLAKDVNGNAATFEPVSITSSDSNVRIEQDAGLTDGLGQYATWVTSAQLGDVRMSAKLLTTSLNTRAQFVAGTPSQALSSLTASPNPLVADGQSSQSVVASFVDALGNRVQNRDVRLSSTGVGQSFTPSTLATNGRGLALSSVSSAVAETSLLSATCDGITVSAPVTYLPGAPAAARSSMSITPAIGIADDTSSVAVLVRLKDALGNPVAFATVVVSTSDAAARVEPASVTTGADGTAVVMVRSSVASTQTVRATAGPLSLTTQVPFVTAGPNGPTTTFVAPTLAALADGQAQALLALTVHDGLDHPVVNAPVQFATSSAGTTLSHTAARTDAMGIATVGVRSTVAAPAVVTAQVGNLGLSASAPFVAGSGNALRSALTVMGSSVMPATGIAQSLANGQDLAQVTVRLADAWGNAVANTPVLLSSSDSNDVISAMGGTTDSAGIVRATYAGTTAGLKTLRAQMPGYALSAQVNLLAGAAVAARSTLVASANTVRADGTQALTLTAYLVDAFGNPVPGQVVTFGGTGATAQALPASADQFSATTATSNAQGAAAITVRSTLAESKLLSASLGAWRMERMVSFVAGQPSVALSSVRLVSSPAIADGANPINFLVTLKDANGNVIKDQALRILSTEATDVALQAVGESSQAGTWSPSILATRTGARVISIIAGDQLLELPLTVLAGVPSELSVLTVSHNVVTTDDRTKTQVRLTVLDALGNPSANIPVALSATGRNNTLNPAQGVTDERGMFVADYSSTQAAIKWVTAAIGTGTPLMLNAQIAFVPGAVSGTTSNITILPAPGTADGLSAGAITVVLRDAQGNVVPAGAVNVTSSKPSDVLAPGTGVSNGVGAFYAAGTFTEAGSRTLVAESGGAKTQVVYNVGPGAVSAATSTLTAAGQNLVADGVSAAELTLLVRDGHGNPVPNQPVTWQGQGANLRLSALTGVTDALGIARLQATATTLGDKSVRAQVGDVTLTVPITYLAGPVAATGSSLTLSPNTVVADGQAVVTLTLHAVDAFGNAAAGRPASFVISGASNTVGPLSGVTDSAGNFRTTVASTLAQDKLVIGTLGPATFNQVAHFVAGAPDAAHSTLVAAPSALTADGLGAAVVTLIAKDAFDNPVGRAPVTLSYSGANGTLLPASGQTLSSGRFVAELLATSPGNHTVTAFVGGAAPLVLSVPIIVTPGLPSATASSLTINPSWITADAVAKASVVVRVEDKGHHPVANQNVLLQVTGSANLLGQASGVTNGQGEFVTDLASSLAENKTVTARAGPAALSAQAQFMAGPVDVTHSFLALSSNTAIADGTTPLTVQIIARDIFGNAVPNASVTVASNGTGDVLSTELCVTDNVGRCAFTMTSTVAQNKSLTAVFGIAPGPTLNANVSFLAGAANAALSTLEVAGSPVLADGQQALTATYTLRDAWGNRVPGQAVQFISEDKTVQFGQALGQTDAAGVVTTSMTSTFVGTHVVMANAAGTARIAAGTFVPGPISPSTSTLVGALAQVVADGQSVAQFVATAKDAFGHVVPNAQVTFEALSPGAIFSGVSSETDGAGRAYVGVASFASGTQTLRAVFADAALQASVDFVAGAVSAAGSTLTLSPNTLVADGQTPVVASVLLRDAQGNPVPGQAVSITSGAAGLVPMPQSGVTDAAGAWQASFTTQVAQAGALQLTAGPIRLTTPFEAVAGPASLAASSLAVIPPSVVADGVSQLWLIATFRDAFNNPVAQGTGVTWSSDDLDDTLGALTATADSQGSATTTATSTRAGLKTFTAAADGVQVSNSATFLPGTASDVSGSFVVSPNRVVADGVAQGQARVRVLDPFGNAIDGAQVAFSALTPQTQLSPAAAQTDLNGEAVVAVSSTQAGTEVLFAAVGNALFSVPMTFVADVPAAAGSTLTFAPSVGLANGQSAVMLTARLLDSHNNPVPAAQVLFNVDGGGTLAAATATTNAAGIAQVSLTSTLAQPQTVTLRSGAVTLQATVPFAAGAVSAARSTIAFNTATVVADNVSQGTVDVQAIDALGNPVPGVTVSFSSASSDATLSAITAVTDASGRAQVQVRSGRAGTALITASMGSTALVTGAPFVAGPVTAQSLTLMASPNVIVADGIARSNLLLQANDAMGNPAKNTPVVFAATGTRAVLSATQATTDELGFTYVTLGSEVAQTAVVSATVSTPQGNVTTTAPVLLLASLPSGTASVVTIAPAAPVANGADVATVTLVAKDALGNAAGNQNVSVVLAAPATCAPMAGVTDSTGHFTCALTTSQAGPTAIALRMGDVQAGSTAVFVPGSPTVAQSSLGTADAQVLANGVAQALVNVRAVDAFGNPVPNQAVTWAATGEGTVIAPAAGITDANGYAQAALRTTQAATHTVTATLTAAQVVKTVDVVAVPGAPVSAGLTLVACPGGSVADGVATCSFELRVLDAQNNRVAGAPVTWSTSGSYNSPSQGSGTADASGVFTAAFATTRAQAQTLTVTTGSASAQSTVVFVPGPPDSAKSTLTGPAQATVADGLATGTFVLTLVDAHENPAPGATVAFAAQGGSGLDVVAPVAVQSNGQGVATATFQSTQAGTKTLAASGSFGTLTASGNFVAAGPSSQTSTFVCLPGAVVADGTAAITCSLTAKDSHNNPIGGAAVSVQSSSPSVLAGQMLGVTAADGSWSTTVTSTLAQSATLTARLGAMALGAPVQFTPGPIDMARVSFTSDTNTAIANGNSVIDAVLMLADAHGNPVVGETVTITSSSPTDVLLPPPGATDALGRVQVGVRATVAGTRNLLASFAGRSIVLPLRFVPGPVSMSRSQLTASPNQTVADGAQVQTLTLVVKDRQYNVIPNQAVVWSVTGLANTLSTPTGITDANGVATLTVASTTAEAKTVTATMGASPVTTSVLFVPGAPSATTTTLSKSLAAVVADQTATTRFTVLVKDAFGNVVPNVPVTLASTGSQNIFGQTSLVSNGAGVASTTLASGVAETKTITASLAGFNKTTSVVFVPGAANAALSSVVSDRTTVLANGADAAMLTATFVDALGNGLPGLAVTMTTPATGAALSQPTQITDALGRVQVTVKATVAQNVPVAFAAGGIELGYNQMFVAGPQNAAASSLSVTPAVVTADGMAFAEVTVTLRDVTQNPLANQSVTLTASGSQNTWVQATGQTNGAGQYTTRLTSTRAEAKTLTAQAQSFNLTGAVTFVPGAASLSASTWTASPNTIVADGVQASTLTLIVADAYGNLVPGQSCTLAATGGQNSLSPSSGITDAQGRLTAVYRSTQAQPKTLSASFNGQSLSTQVVATPGPAALAQSSMVASPNMVTADGAQAASVVVTLLDTFANPVPGASVLLATTAVDVALSPNQGVTDSTGRFVASATSHKAQAATFTSTVGGVPLAAGVQFVAGPPAAGTSAFSLDPNTAVVADGLAPGYLVLSVRDAFGNPVPNQQVQFGAPTSQATLTPPTAVTDAAGRAVSLVTSTVAESKTLRAILGAAPGSPIKTTTALFVPGPSSAITSSLTVSPASVTADGATPANITVIALDAAGNIIAKEPITLAASGVQTVFGQASGLTGDTGQFLTTITSVKAQSETITATLASGHTALLAPVTFTPGAPSAQASSLVASPNQVVANAVDKATVALVLRDAKGNPVPNVAVSFSATGSANGFSAVSATTNSVGMVQVTLASTVAQAKTVTAQFGAASLVVPVVFVPGPPNAANSVFTAAPAQVLANGVSTITLSVLAKDAYNNLIGQLPVSISGSGTNNVFGATTGATDNQGVWSTTVASTVAQVQDITAVLGTASPASLVKPITFVPGVPVSATSTFAASPASFVANNVAIASFVATARDAFGNVVPNQDVVISINGVSRTLSALSGRTNAAGTFTTTVNTPLAQSFSAQASINGGFVLNASATAVPGPTTTLTLAGLAGGLSAATSSPQVATFDAMGNATPAYRGTVTFTSTDANAGLPSAYIFTAADGGVHTFAQGATLVSPGVHTVTVQATDDGALTASQNNLSISAPLTNQVALAARAGRAQCLDLKDGLTAQGTPFVSAPCNNTVHQVFTLSTDNTLRALGQCLTVPGGNYASGQGLEAATCTARTPQRFILNASGQLVAAGNSSLCVDLTGATANTQAILAPCNAATLSQQFVPKPATQRLVVVNPALGQVLEVAGASYAANAALQNGRPINAAHQAFDFDNTGALRIGGLCVQPAQGVVAADKALVLGACTGTSAQQFVFAGAALKPVSDASLCVDMGTSSSSQATALKACNASPGQTLSTAVASQYYRYVTQVASAAATCLEVTGGNTAIQTPLIANVCSTQLNQTWNVNPGATANVQYGPSCADVQPGLLNILGLVTYNNQGLFTNPCTLSAAQNWRVFYVPGDSVMLAWQAVASPYCMQAKTTPGGQAVLMNCSSSDVGQRYYQLARTLVLSPSTSSSLCVAVAGGWPVPDAPLQYAACAPVSTSQGLVWQADGSLTHGGLCVDVATTVAAGATLKLGNCTTSTSQKWLVQTASGQAGGATIKAASNTNLCVDASTAAINGIVRLSACSGTAAQAFSVN